MAKRYAKITPKKSPRLFRRLVRYTQTFRQHFYYFLLSFLNNLIGIFTVTVWIGVLIYFIPRFPLQDILICRWEAPANYAAIVTFLLAVPAAVSGVFVQLKSKD